MYEIFLFLLINYINLCYTARLIGFNNICSYEIDQLQLFLGRTTVIGQL